jgi:YidC/Oxa1 family membrane protein insertase
MEQKNFLLAMGLIVSFLILWSVFVVPRFTPPRAPVPAADAQAPVVSVTPPSSEANTVRVESRSPVHLSATILRDQNNEITLVPRGGAVQSWRVKSKGQEVDLVLSSDNDPLPLASFPDVVYKISARDGEAVMEASLANGVRLTKTLKLGSQGYLHSISYRFENPTSQPVQIAKWAWGWGPGMGTADSELKENSRLIRALSLGKLRANVLKEGNYSELGRWAGVDNRYYFVAFIPKSPSGTELSVSGAKDKTDLKLLETTSIPARGETVLEYDLYAGPKGYTQLKKYRLGLEESVDFGYFSALGKLTLNALNGLRKLTGNYGWAIVLLTIGLQILMVPLTIKSFKATLAMKKVQPKIAEIQARFKNDPKRLNVEMMNVYKTSGTNPFGGCLPMLLQLPIFWALFTTLRNAYELRGAPFIGWIHDLSTPDVLIHPAGFPVHALPLVMGGAMFFQQRMSGAVSDPTQRQMMMIMPIMFTFMFYGFPSGLVLYWLTNNLMTMAFQWGFQRMSQQTPSVVNTTLVK